VSGWSVVMHPYLYYFPLSLSLSRCYRQLCENLTADPLKLSRHFTKKTAHVNLVFIGGYKNTTVMFRAFAQQWGRCITHTK